MEKPWLLYQIPQSQDGSVSPLLRLSEYIMTEHRRAINRWGQ